MTESNTPPENQKKKSAFSRFFSRKKNKVEETKPSSAEKTVETTHEPQGKPSPEHTTTQENNESAIQTSGKEVGQQAASGLGALFGKGASTPNINIEVQPKSATADDSPAPQLPEATAKEPELVVGKEADTIQQAPAPFKSAVDTKPSSGNEPSADNTSSAGNLSSAVKVDEKTLADKKPLADAEKTTNQAPTNVNADLSPPNNSTVNPNELTLAKADETTPLQNNSLEPKPKEQINPSEATEATIEEGLTKSRSGFLQKIGNVFKGSFNLDDDLFDELEELLITSDIGVEASLSLVEKLRSRVKSEKIQDAKGVVAGLRAEIAVSLTQSEKDWVFSQKPYVIMMVGVNGAGKTTTTAKIAKYFQDQGKSVMLAAADTFRAAAVEQLQEWGKRLDIPVIAQPHGADAAAVAHDALTSAIAKNVDVLMIDTAGRLHTQSDLMAQLEKVNRVLAKIDPTTPHEVMQILDAGTGQNALTQLEHFQKAVGVSSVCLTKLDGSAKGGMAISLSEKYHVPIRFIGIGEGFNDLKRFRAKPFADALIPDLKS